MTDLSKSPILTDLQSYMHYSRYARFDEKLKRRETYEEAIDRYLKAVDQPASIAKVLKEYLMTMQVFPSMRMLRSAGEVLDKINFSAYNCGAVAIDSLKSFTEIMYLLMCGVGIGTSVEKRFIDLLPDIPKIARNDNIKIVVEDSREGWTDSFLMLLQYLVKGVEPIFDFSRIRPKGARLKTFGGTASGPEVLENLFNETIEIFKSVKDNKKLTSINCFDLICHVGQTVVAGGSRRSALLVLTDLDDQAMANIKSGEWWKIRPQAVNANISAVYDDVINIESFAKEWEAIKESKSGERGIFNRHAIREKIRSTRGEHDWLVNPCGEVFLRNRQLCNVTEVACKANDFLYTLQDKITIATILGTLQARLTNFPDNMKEWKENCEAEHLLAVSLTGIFDCPFLLHASNDILTQLKDHAREVNIKWAKKLNINAAPSITTIKPSGSVSLLADCSPGIHPDHAKNYELRVREPKTSAIARMLIAQGFEYEQEENNLDGILLVFDRVKSSSSITRHEITALEHFRIYLKFANFWCDHNPSISINVREDEWESLKYEVFKNFNQLYGLTFFPFNDDDHIYTQAPYKEVAGFKKNISKIDWSKLSEYENKDNTTSLNEVTCFAGACQTNF